MTLPIYPDRSLLPGLAYNTKWSPQFFNMPPAKTGTGAEIDLLIAQYPLHAFELTYEFLRDGPGWSQAVEATLEFRTMMGFLLQVGGASGRFLFRHSPDHKVYQQPIGVGDGATTTFTLVRTFGTGVYSALEPIGQLDPGQPFNAYVAGSLVAPGAYTLGGAPVAQTITFTTPPALSAAITVDMWYLFYCKFPDNSNTVEQFMDRLWMLQKVAIQSCRPGT